MEISAREGEKEKKKGLVKTNDSGKKGPGAAILGLRREGRIW